MTTAPGDYRILAIADGAGEIAETNETNNTRASGILRVGPDLVVSVLTVPATAAAGEAVAATDTAANTGGGAAAASLTQFYLSANTTWEVSDILLGSRAVPALAADGTNVASTSLTIPSSTAVGSWYVLAKADANAEVAESFETNNVKASAVMKVGPDLTVSALTGPSSAVRGATVVMTTTTTNAGGGSADSSSTSFYLSTNSTLDAADLLLGSRSIAALAGGGSDSGPTSLTIPTTVATGHVLCDRQSRCAGIGCGNFGDQQHAKQGAANRSLST